MSLKFFSFSFDIKLLPSHLLKHEQFYFRTFTRKKKKIIRIEKAIIMIYKKKINYKIQKINGRKERELEKVEFTRGNKKTRVKEKRREK